MTLKLYYHPLSSYCHKAIIALYENDIPFEPVVVNLMDPVSSAEMRALWPVGKFPVLKDEKRGHAIAESSVIIDYLDTYYAQKRLIPADADAAWQARMWDRFFDLYVMEKQGKLVDDNLRPAEARDLTASPRRRRRWKSPTRSSRASSAPAIPGSSATIIRWPTAPRRRRCSMPASSCRSPTQHRSSRLTMSGWCGGHHTCVRSRKPSRSSTGCRWM